MSKVNKFGTFGGVFVPSILTILGVIMYLRLPMIIGEAGLYMTLGIILLAHVISVTTGLSVSSIATDKKVEAGGTYYMISRSLGLPIGGTLGLALFVGLSFSVSLYLIGFAESFLGYWGFDVNIDTIRIAGTAILLIVTTITLISTSLAIKTQYFIMAAIFLSLLSIVFGSHAFAPEVPNLNPPATGFSFMLLFGIFFPAVTGFEAGVSMSGDLKDPKKSIPGGTISAILVGLAVYIALALFFAFTVDKDILSSDSQVLLKIAAVPELVIAGIWGATLSSALGSILGAPRILQATAADAITPRFFAKGIGKSNEPRNALILTFLIAEVGILIGELDVIARIVSIFFITTYGFLNLSCAFETWTSADFRPSFKAPIWVSLLGSIACILVMIQLDFIAMLSAIIILGLLYFYLKRKELSLSSGDAWSGVWASLVKSGLHKLNVESLQSRNWRPNLMMFAGSEERRPYLTELGLAITGKLGLLSSFELEESKSGGLVKLSEEEKQNGETPAFFKHRFRCENIYKAIGEISGLYGFSGIEPNTVLMGWSERRENRKDFIELIERFEKRNLNSLFLHFNRVKKFGACKTIDVWWSGWGRNLSLALNLLRHITSTQQWQNATIRLLIIQNQPGEVDRVFQQVQRILVNYRITVTLKVLNNYADQNSKNHIIATESASTDLTIVGIPDNSYDDLQTTYDHVSDLGHKLGTCLFINAASSFEEYNVISYDEAGTNLTTDSQEWILPDLEESKYPEIATDVAKIDEYGQVVLKLFIEKTFKGYYRVDENFYKALNELVATTSKSLTKASSIDQPYKRGEAITKSRRHFIENVRALLVKYKDNDIRLKKEVISHGVDWYLDRLSGDVNKFPKHLRVQYDRDEFDIASSDNFATRWFKIRKRFSHPFSKESIPVTVNYREIASHFLRDNRYQFLTILLSDFERTEQESLRQISEFISYCEINFQRQATQSSKDFQEADVNDLSAKMVSRMEKLVAHNLSLYKLYEGRILLEFRKNLSQLAHYLERIRVNDELTKKKRSKSFYSRQAEELRGFADNWEENHQLTFNTVLSNVHLLDFLGKLEKELQRFRLKLNQWIVKEGTEPFDQINNILNKIKEGPIEKRQPLIPAWNVDGSRLLDEFESMGDQLISYAKTLPAEITVDSKESEGPVIIPLSSLIIHLLEIRLSGPFYDYLEMFQEKFKQSSLVIQDHANLAIFKIYNAEAEDSAKSTSEVMSAALFSIENEQRKMINGAEEAIEKLAHLLTELRDSLHISTLTANIGEFSQLIRQHKSKKITSKVGSFILRLRENARRLLVGILYSQSKGVLLAERLTETTEKSFSEDILKLMDNVTPDPVLMQKLPHYYASLFSGRSSISDNFWVKRPVEEEQLKSALDRYKAGMSGMIIVLGERNAGKTALCKYFCESNFADEKVYHVFSRDTGSGIEEFNLALQKATRIDGDSNEIFNSLVHGSVIVLHDLELWWERSGEKGLETIRHIKQLVDSFSSKCLFIVNLNPFAYEVLKRVEELDTFSLGTIRCRPFNSFELRQLILLRHKSSGLQFTFGNKNEEDINEIVLARVFNRIFEYSHGNPGMAMNAWLCSMEKFTGKNISMSMPIISDTEVINKLPALWSMICIQLLMHKRMSLKKLSQVISQQEEEIGEQLNAMTRIGIVKARNMELYGLNPYIEFLLISVFRKKEWI